MAINEVMLLFNMIFLLIQDIMDNFQLGEDFTECIKLGILHSPTGRFLTAEVFNNEINVSGTALRRRQVWTIITERGRPDTVYIQSHLGRFLSADKDGKVNAASKIPGVDERFLLEYSPQATGEWSFRSEAHSYYLSGSENQISCFSKSPVWWAVRLAVHPQINLRNQFRSRYLRLLPDSSELRADQPHPWGSETLIWLEQVPMTSGPTAGRGGGANVGRAAVARFGRVALRSENGQYLKPDGSLADEMEDSVLFAFELRPGHPRTFAFRDSNGAYLTTIGPGTVKVKTNVTTPGKEELFLIERAALQVGILAHNNKYASVKQGVEISANQHELDDTAIFQLEYIGGKGFNSNDAIASSNSAPQSPSGDPAPLSTGSSATNGMTPGIFCLVTGYWRLRARSGKLWLMAPSAGVQSTGSDGDKCSLFEILTLSDDAGRGHVVLKANTPGSGQSLSARKLGAISSSGRTVCEVQSPAETDLFRVILVNRPSIALVSLLTGGFVSRGKQTTLDCSSVTYERFLLQLTKNNTYQLFARDTKSSFSLWTVSPSGLIHLKPTKRRPDDDPLDPECLEPGTEFLFHFLGCGRTLIRVVGEVNGGFTLVKAEPKGEVKWDSANEILANYIWEIYSIANLDSMDFAKTTVVERPKATDGRSVCPIDSRPEIIYPTRKPFQRYLEELVNPKIWNAQPSLVKREQPTYLKASRMNENPYKFIRFERINQLKEREQARKDEERQCHESARDLSEKLPFSVRQRNTAASSVRKLIHDENVQELNKYGRLFGPNSLTAQPLNSKFTKLKDIPSRLTSQTLTMSRRLTEDPNESRGVLDEKRSSDIETESRDLASKTEAFERKSVAPLVEKDLPRVKVSLSRKPKEDKPDEGLKAFVQDRRRVCLLELAVRTKKGEVKRLDAILHAENEFLKKEEHELIRRHEDHDRYLKSICQRTAEAIRLAEGEAHKRNEITDRIKRARYRLAHLNAECVKLEEEYLRLSTYKNFLRNVFDTFRERHTQTKVVSASPESVKSEETGRHSMPMESFESDPTIKHQSTGDATSSPTQRLSEASSDTVSLIEFFTNPQDLVDILSELESNNLTLIENVQEQEEVCERVRAKAHKLYTMLNAERDMVDQHIERERENISGIKENVNAITLARNTLSDFVLLERYAKVFHLGDMEQFESLDPGLLYTSQTPSTKVAVGTQAKQQQKQQGAYLNTDNIDAKPTIANLLSVLQFQVQRVYSSVYGTNEGGARLDTLVMLRRLETTVDELSEMLNAYPRAMVLKAKRTVDERNRVSARRRQKAEGRLAYERRLQKAI
ncbi:hypothetical protein T265_15128, partial [Opisthorchis viverrini]